MKKLRALLVDDEPLALARLRNLLARLEVVDVVAECEDGRAAVAAVAEHQPDVIFLDIQMPEADGLEVLDRIERNDLPLVIFTTAFDEFALRAFRSQALDYLLKPIEPERLRQSVARAARIVDGVESRALVTRLAQLGGGPGGGATPRPTYLTRVGVRRGDRVLVVRVEQIDWIESESNYARLHIGKESYLLRATMYALEEELDPNEFARIHRATIVNLNRLAEVSLASTGDPFVVLADGTRLEVQRPYVPRLRDTIRRA